jgi:tetratricopeptide (TPR) repeat protein
VTVSRRLAHVAYIAIILGAACFTAAPAIPATPRPLQAQRSAAATSALQTTIIQAQKEIQQHQEDLGVLKSSVDALNTRISDMSNRIGDVNTWLAEFTVIAALGAGLIALFAYQTSAQKARKTAEEWLASNATDLLSKITTLQAEAKRDLDDARKDAPEARHVITATPIQHQTLENAQQTLPEEPEKNFTSEAWTELAFAAYTGEKLALAAEYFENAAQAPGASDEEIAKALFNKGATLGTLNHSNDEIAAYDALIARFENAAQVSLREQVAMALFSKGVALGKLSRQEEALLAYDALITRFENEAEPTLREQVSMALFSKGVALGKLSRPEEAIAAYDALISGFENATEPARIAKALFNKGATLGRLNRLEEAIAVYDMLIAHFENAEDPAIHELLAKASADKELARNAMG